MGGYIGATAVGLVTTAADVQGDITSTDTTPEVILKNTTETDADGSRDGKITFKGEQSGGEESTLAQIQSSHDGTADDQKGDLIFKTNDGSDGASPTERLRIDSSGVVILGHDDATNGTFASGQKLQMVGTDFVSSSFGISRFSADGSGPSISLSKSRSGSIGTDTVVQDNDDLGSIIFSAADGTDLATQGAVITAEVDGTPGGNDLPTRLTISTTGDGNSSPTERMRIDSDGNVGLGVSPTTAYGNALQIHDTGTSGANLRLTDSNTGSGTGNGFEIIVINADNYIMNREAGPIFTSINGNTVQKIDADGNTTFPKQPAFQVNKGNSTQANIAVNSDVLVTFNTETFDIGSNFASNTFTAPVTGKYVFSFLLRVDSVDIDSNYYIPFIETSNRKYRVIVDPNFSSDPAYFSFTLTCLADMDANDTCVIKINQGSGAAASDISGDPDYTWFTGYLAC